MPLITFAAYRKGKGTLKGETLESLVEHFHFNPQRLLKGEGEPFPGARNKYPEVCGPDISEDTHKPRADIISVHAAPYEKGAITDGHQDNGKSQPISIGEDLAIAARVLESKTPYAVALHLNIQSFGKAIAADKRIDTLEFSLRDLQSEINQLRLELDRMKATHENPDGGSGSFTGTSGIKKAT